MTRSEAYHYERTCQQCQGPYVHRSHTGTSSRFCSRECGALASPAAIAKIQPAANWQPTTRLAESLVVVTCAQCNRRFLRDRRLLSKSKKSGLHFCNQRCRVKSRRHGGVACVLPRNANTGLSKYRKRALRRTAECNRCGYNVHPKMLDVHHGDGNRANNADANLETLCVWCHALVTRGVKPHAKRRRSTAKRSRAQQPLKLGRYRHIDLAEMALAMIGGLHTAKTVAARLGVSRQAVQKMATKHGILWFRLASGDVSACDRLIAASTQTASGKLPEPEGELPHIKSDQWRP